VQKILELFQDDDGAIASCELQWKTSDNCALRHRIAASVILHALTMFVADMFKSRCQLDAENLFLITNSTSLCGVTPSAARAERNHCLTLGQQQSFPGVALFGSRVVFCGRLGIRYNAGQMVRDLQAHISCQSEGALAGERDWALLSPFRYLHPHFILQERAAMFIFIL
jgi:hypothetical protein